MLVDPSNFAKTHDAIREVFNGEFWEANFSLSHNSLFKSSVILLSDQLPTFSVIGSYCSCDALLKRIVTQWMSPCDVNHDLLMPPVLKKTNP